MKAMESKSYNDVITLIVPLIDDLITENDLSEKAGFVDAFTSDKNRPYLDNHTFLMYKDTGTIESLNTKKKLSKLPTFYNKRFIKINGEHYTVFTFINMNKDIEQLKKGCLFKNTKSQVRILNFWSTKSDDLANQVLLSNFRLGYSINNILPEQDYEPQQWELKSKSLTVKIRQAFFIFVITPTIDKLD